MNIVFDNGNHMTKAELLRRAERSSVVCDDCSWPWLRSCLAEPKPLLEKVVCAAYRMFENSDRQKARCILDNSVLPLDIVNEIVEFI